MPESMTETKRDSHVLTRYRGAEETRERASSSGPKAVEDFLKQFEGDERIGVALEIASAAALAIEGEIGGNRTAVSYAKKEANLGTLGRMADAVDELRWMAGVAGTADYMRSSLDSPVD